jgi:two-component system cell cycle response regulator
MKKRAVNVLVVEDDLVDYKAVQRALSSYSEPMFLLHRADTMEHGKRMLEGADYDAVILDLGLPDVNGMDSIIHFQANAPETPIVVLTGQTDHRNAVGAVGMGAEDFLLKSELAPARLEEKLRLAMERHHARLDVLQNVNALERTVHQLSAQARRDALTGLANRPGLEEHFSLLRSQGAKAVPVAMVDLDNFKAVNDVHGHATGDKVLAELGRRIQVAAGPNAFVARVGGDEFVAAFSSMSREEAKSAAQDLRQAVSEKPFNVGGGIPPLALTSTVVLSELPASELKLEDVLTLTHEHLTQGKVHGKDQVLCTWEDGVAAPEAGPRSNANRPLEGFVTLGAPVVLLGAMETIAYRMRFVAHPQGGFIEDRQLDLARLDRSLADLSLACVRNTLAWADGPPFPALHMDLEIDVLNRDFMERLLKAVPAVGERQRLCFFLPAQFTEEQGERASKVVSGLRKAGFAFGVRDAGGGGTVVENLLLLDPTWIRLSPMLCSGVAQVRAKRDKLQYWVNLLKATKTPLLADQVNDKDLAVFEELGLFGAVLSGLTKQPGQL